ncbi:MAG: helix-turn-helix transcriptional regulator [Euryarchaeota archaeon]|nr:helix-turn-helix transcriptional regulator [Euryarchaeota archaeon]MDE1836147.1 helix-turn-helix transcriptional regulator [Euryarchaeota archaeon]MDE2044125.1 helix-turn-helix transcriptional regulator [Thermoplasmata archaeon]
MAEVKRRQVDKRLEQVRSFMHTLVDHPEFLDIFPQDMVVPLGADVSSVFAPARVELMLEISRGRATVGALARALHRNRPAVSRDLHLLSRHGLVRIRRVGRESYPELTRRFVVLPLGPPGGRTVARGPGAATA